ncbi:MAG: lambda exonuclease family protein [Hyphomicrobium sp.]|jgi:exodeoxyribonuclease (lambda-induced)
MIHHDYQQGSEEWLSIRKGCITGSRFKDCREYKLLTKAQKEEGRKRGEPSSKLLGYAYDTARERVGGSAPQKFQNAAMRTGTEQEPLARLAYEARTGNLVEEVGFFTTEDFTFGLSPDGLIGDYGVLEIKTMVSSDTLFKAVADGDHSEYIDQINGYLWLLGRQWVDLVLWAPDLKPLGLHLTVRRITRDEDAIEELESDLMAFAELVKQLETKLRTAAEQKESA